MPLVIRWLNAQVASGAIATHDKVFMIGEAKGHLLACDYLPSTSSSGKEWLVEYRNADGDLARMARSLWDRGFRYVLLNKLWIDYNLRNGIKIRRRHLATTLYTVEKFQAEHGERPVFGGDVVLFRIRPPG
jgi:hypothetical protein